MIKSARALIGSCVAIAALAMPAGPASALRSLQDSSPEAITQTGANVTFEDDSRFMRTICAGVTLHGIINERVVKSAGASLGSITEGRTNWV
jgi:hypothetical protein